MEKPGYAIILDSTYEAVLLRNLLRDAAQKEQIAWSKTTLATIRDRHWEKHECFAKYAERCEHIREQEAQRIVTAMQIKALKGETDAA